MRCPKISRKVTHQLPADRVFRGCSKRSPWWGHKSLWQRESGFSSRWRGQDGNHPLSMMHSLEHTLWEAPTQSHINPDTRTPKPVSMLLGHHRLLQQQLLLCVPSLKSPTMPDVSPFPLV